ncbi:MAG: hypothetical protein HKN29_01455, partial [Rhodothermales bacterium]|nr:hypothetical protein [Rhodothermales bacterium]
TAVVNQILARERIARLMYQADADGSQESLRDVLAAVSEFVWNSATSRDSYESEIQRIVQTVWTDGLVAAASDSRSAPGVRTRLWAHLQDLADWLVDNPGDGYEEEAHRGHTLTELERYLLRDYVAPSGSGRAPVPPGSPIGMDSPGMLAIGSGDGPLLRTTMRQAWLSSWYDDHRWCSLDN